VLSIFPRGEVPREASSYHCSFKNSIAETSKSWFVPKGAVLERIISSK